MVISNLTGWYLTIFYRIRIEHEGYASKEIAVQTRLDVNIGEIVLESK